MKNKLSKLLIFLGVLILVGLGVWQLFRMTYKEALISDLQSKSDMPIATPQDIGEEYLYRMVEICGYFEKGKDLFVYNKPNYVVLAPFYMENSDRGLLVARGQVSPNNKDKASFLIEDENKICIAGMLAPSEKEPLFMPAYDGSPKKPLLTINTKSASNLLSVDLPDMFLIVTDKNTDDLLMPLKKPEAQRIYNNHLEYAITWFTLAAILMFMGNAPLKKQ